MCFQVDHINYCLNNESGAFSPQVAYECEYCHKMFVTPAQLTAHRWHHTKPFWCNHCDMRFAAKGNLVVHLRR